MKRVHLLAVALLVWLAGCTREPKDYINNGNRYFGSGKYKEASIMYRRALQKDMKSGEAWYRLGLANLKLNNFGEARRDLVRAVDLAEERKKYDANSADALARIGDIDLIAYYSNPQANRELRDDLRLRSTKLLQLDPNSFDGLRLKGNWELTQKDHLKPAIELLEKANQIKPYQPDVVDHLVRALFNDKQPEKAIQYANELINRHKTFVPMYDVLYRYYLFSNHPDQAEEIRKREAANNPTDGHVQIALASHYYITKRQPEMQATLNHMFSDLKTFPQAHMLAGDFYFNIGNVNAAVEQYQQGPKDDPKNKGRYNKKLAEALTLLGKRDEAMQVVTGLLKDDPQDAEAIAMQAALLLDTAKPGDADKVLAQLQPLLSKTSPTDKARSTILHFNMGRAYALKGDGDNARLQFEEAIKVSEKPYVPALMALSQLELAKGQNPQALQHANVIVAVDPRNLTARLVRTMAMMNMGDLERCRKELDAVIQMVPKSNDARFQHARLNYLEKRYNDAEQDYEMLRKSKDTRGMAGIIDCKIAEHKGGDAIQMIKDELAQQPNDLLLQYTLASLEYSLGRYSESAKDYQILLAKNSSRPAQDRETWYLRMGEAQRFAGDVGSATASFQKAHEIAPKDSMPTLEQAMMLDTSGHPAEARKLYEDVLKIEPDNTVALNNLAYAKANDGVDLDQALTYAQRARTKSPSDLNVMDTLGLIYLRKNLTDDSLRMLQELVGKVPDSATFHLHYAMALYQKGNKPEAKKELDLALHHKPSDQESQQIKELMQKIG